jgi:hypothetical protein
MVYSHALNWTLNACTDTLVIPTTEWFRNSDSYAQVESLVYQKLWLRAKPVVILGKASTRKMTAKASKPLTIPLSEKHKTIIKAKAQAAGISVNRFVLASALGSDCGVTIMADRSQSLSRWIRVICSR